MSQWKATVNVALFSEKHDSFLKPELAAFRILLGFSYPDSPRYANCQAPAFHFSFSHLLQERTRINILVCSLELSVSVLTAFLLSFSFSVWFPH